MGTLARGSCKKAMKFLLLLVASLALCGSVANAGFFSKASCSGKTVPSGACALLYDEEDCDGWEYQVPRGYSELGWAMSAPRRTTPSPSWSKRAADSSATTTQTGMTFGLVATLWK